MQAVRLVALLEEPADTIDDVLMLEGRHMIIGDIARRTEVSVRSLREFPTRSPTSAAASSSHDGLSLHHRLSLFVQVEVGGSLVEAGHRVK